MSNFRSAILIIGLLIFFVASSLLTVLILYVTGVIVTDPIELVYSIDNIEKLYDGTPLTADAYTLDSGEILEGHIAQVTIIGSQTNVGESESSLEVKIFDKNGFDVSDEYAVKVNAGKLTVNPQEITVQVKGAEIVYNGQKVDFGKDDYEVTAGTLAAGHAIAAFLENTTLLNAGDELPQDLHPIVYDAFGNRVTENYNVTFDFTGTVKIVKRPISVKPVGVTKTYDGTVVTADKFEIFEGSLAIGQTAQANIVKVAGGEASEQRASQYHIKIEETSFVVSAQDGTNVTKNYEITYATDYLNIEKRNITLSTATTSFVYDGEEHYDDTISVISGSLAPDEEIEVTEYTTLTDVAREVNELTYEIRGEGGPVTQNYNPIYITGTIEVTKRPLNVSLKDFVAGTYTGAEITLDKDSAFGISAEGDEETEQTVIGQWGIDTSDFNLVPLGSTVNAGIYSYTASYLKQDGNFDITFDYGRYEIKKKPVTLADNNPTAERKVTYGGTYDFKVADELCINKADGNGEEDYTVSEAVYTVRNSITATSKAQVFTFTSVRVKDKDGKDITDNLEIAIGQDFKISVGFNKRTLKFTYSECEYTSALTNPSVLDDHAHCTPVPGDIVSFTIQVTDMYFIATNVTIKNSDGKDVTDLYAIDVGSIGGENPYCGSLYVG